MLYGRKIVIEKQKTNEQLVKKYKNLFKRKVLILVPKKKRNINQLFPSQRDFLNYFSKFGEIENAKLYKQI